jgi:hypothetical protein
MRPFSPRMFPDLVTLLALVETRDTDLGVVESFGMPGAPIACRVRYIQAASGRGGSAFAGESETASTFVTVALAADPGVKKGDRFQPMLAGGLLPKGAPVRVQAGAKPHDAAGFLWTVRCSEIE